MAKLAFITRGTSSPQGKQKVYFAAHPNDYRFLQPIAEKILKLQNCAVFYDEEPDAAFDEELLFADIKEMQLVVIPVTTKFLCEENRARCVEFRFAVENHIPVLPLLQEDGLEELFNMKCGSLQCLNERLQDITEISFDEKLKRFLESVLVGDELAQQVRDAFDAYIFLSYRKKDRKHAQELMRLIHANDFCRDIAIWYDEYLVPGENFNDAIEKAMEKSDLFAMAVTPNLINEDNYVKEIEFPKARDAKKEILSAEMVPTDPQGMRESFHGLSDVIDACDEEALREALREKLQSVAEHKKKDNP